MVRYPDTVILVSPGVATWIEGKANIAANTQKIIACEVQPDSSNYSETINGKAIVAKYRVFTKYKGSEITTAKTIIYAGKEYNLLGTPYITQLDVQMKIG